MLTVIETPIFLRNAAEVWSDDERAAYAKAKFDNLSSDFLRRVKETFDGS